MSEKYKQYDIVDIMKGGLSKEAKEKADKEAKAAEEKAKEKERKADTTEQSTTTTTPGTVQTFVGDVVPVNVKINFQDYVFNLSDFRSTNILIQPNIDKIDASANLFLNETDKYKTDYLEQKNNAIIAVINYTKSYDQYEEGLKEKKEWQDLKIIEKYEQRNFNNLDTRLTSIQKKEKEIDADVTIPADQKEAKKAALHDARNTSDLKKDQLIKMKTESQSKLKKIQEDLDQIKKTYMEKGLEQPTTPTPANSPQTLYDLSQTSIKASTSFKALSLNSMLETNIKNLESYTKENLTSIEQYFKTIDTSYNLAKWNAGTVDIYRDDTADDDLAKIKKFRDQILKIKGVYEEKFKKCTDVAKNFNSVKSGLEAQFFLVERTTLKTTVKTFFMKMQQYINTMTAASVDYSRLNDDLIKMINESVDDIGLYDPYVKEIFLFLKTLSLIGNDIDKITKDITTQQRYRNVFDEKLIISINNIQKQIAILDINVIKVKLKELQKFKNSLYDLKRLDIFYRRISELQIELEECKENGLTSKKRMDEMEEELNDLRKIKKTLNYAMSDLVDQYTKNLEKVNKILTNQGIESEENRKIEEDKLANLQIEQVEGVISSITEDTIIKELDNIEKLLQESEVMGDRQEIENVMKETDPTQLVGGESSKSTSGITDDLKKSFVSVVGVRMSIFNRKEFHLLFTIMSDEQYFKLLCVEVFANKKDFLMKFLDVIFVDLSLKDDTNTNNLESLGGSESVRDSTYYNYYYNFINTSQELQWIQSDESKRLKKITKPLFLNTYIEKLKQGNNYKTHFNSRQILKYRIVEKIFNFFSQSRVFKHLKIIYNMLIKKICPIYTFVKVRQDTKIPNPRYEVKPRIDIKESYTEEGSNDQDDIALTITYYNSDKSLPFADPQDPEGGKQLAQEGKFNKGASPTALVDFQENATKETYYIGPVTQFFQASSKNPTIAKDIAIDKNITDKIVDGNDVIIIGNGQSGSGKTSTLVYLRNKDDDTKSDEGIIPIICNGQKLHEAFDRLEVSAVEIYVKWDETIEYYNEITSSQYFVQNLRLTDDDVIKRVSGYEFIKEEITVGDKKEKTWIYTNKDPTPNKSKLSDIIDRLLNRRLIGPTKNNPDSSRSHVLILIKFFKKGESDPHSKMVICDLAGVEDRFKCGLNDIITSFDKLSASNTFYRITGTIQVDNSVAKCDPVKNTSSNTTPYKQKGGLQKKEFTQYTKFEEQKFNPQKYYTQITGQSKYDISYNFPFDIRNQTELIQQKNLNDYIVLKKIMEKYAAEYPYAYQDSRSFVDNFFKTKTEQQLDEWVEFLFGIADRKKIDELSKNENLKKLIEYMLYNCLVRRYEGYIINKTLREMRSLITNLTFNIIKNKLVNKMNPLFFLIPSVYTDKIYCYGDNYQFDKNYNYFYGSNQFEPISNKSGGSIIFDIMFGKDKIQAKNITQCSGSDPVKRFDLSVSKVSISLITLINLTAGIRVNNPPNPPYINVNKLKQIINILKYFKDIKQNRSDFFTTNFETIFKPVLEKIRDYLIGKYTSRVDVVDLDAPPDEIADDVTDIYNIILGTKKRGGGLQYQEFISDKEENGKKNLSSAGYTQIKNRWSLFEMEDSKADSFSLPVLIKLTKDYNRNGLNMKVYIDGNKDNPYKIDEKQVYRQTKFKKNNLSYFREIGSKYVFYKNTFSSNELLKTLYIDKLIAPGSYARWKPDVHERILKVFENCMQIKNEDLNFSDPVYKSTIPDKDDKGQSIDRNKINIIDFYYYLAKYIYDLIDSSNPATLIGTVDFQEYTQFRDTEKLYMTCDGQNNSWQINPKANEDFLTQPLPQQLKGGSNDLFDWIDINI
jgi:hypothetical protein